MQMLYDPSRFLAIFFGCKPQTTLFYALEVTSSFIISAVAHMFMLPFHHPHLRRLNIVVFFLLQPIAIMSEVFVEKIFVIRNGNSELIGVTTRMILRWTWTLVWFYTTLPLAGVQFFGAGVLPVQPVPISIMHGLIEGKWWVV